MYEDAFDSFLSVDTWHTGHPEDRSRFFRALDLVVHVPQFNPEKMGEHFRAKHPKKSYEIAINRYVDAAWAVRDFFQATD